MLGEGDPVLVCGKPIEFESPMTPLEAFLKEHEEEWLNIEGVRGVFVATNLKGEQVGIIVLAKWPQKTAMHPAIQRVKGAARIIISESLF
jgi:hypothetical protein